MRFVEWTDDKGWLHRSVLRDGDPNELAPVGLASGVPDVNQLDWDAIRKDLNNNLHNRGLFTWEDVQEIGGLQGAIMAVMRRRLIQLYRENSRR